MGYAAGEVVGRHHSMFVDAAFAASADYRAFWAKLNRGETESGNYKRIAKGGREVWLQASYNPIPDANGKPFKVVEVRHRRDRGHAGAAGAAGRGPADPGHGQAAPSTAISCIAFRCKARRAISRPCAAA